MWEVEVELVNIDTEISLLHNFLLVHVKVSIKLKVRLSLLELDIDRKNYLFVPYSADRKYKLLLD